MLKTHDKGTLMDFEKAIEDYRQWMISSRYAGSTCLRYHQVLLHFVKFINDKKIPWDSAFTYDTLQNFQTKSGLVLSAHAVKGFSRYLFEENRINRPIEKTVQTLPELFEAYLDDCACIKEVKHLHLLRTRKTLCAFWHFLETNGIWLKSVRIEQIDAFLADHNQRYTKEYGGTQRSILRGFFIWLYQKKVVKKNLASMIVGAPVFGQRKPPKFLRLHEVKTLFTSLTGQTSLDLRVAAMVYLGFYLGLRPIEICRIELDDIEFKKQEIRILQRKNTKPITLPLPECCIKAIAAYILGGRPKTENRRLFITHRVPYRPVLAMSVSKDIARAMKRAGLKSTAYWLRHTYAQNLLEAGVSFFEIKEMMGHDRIQTTRRYLHIHTKLMREVLFDDDDV